MDPSSEAARLTHADQAPYGNVGIYAYEYQSDKQYNVVSEDQATDTYQIGTLEADRLYEYDTLDRLRAARMTDSPDWNEVDRAWSTWTDLDDLGNWAEFSDREATAVVKTFDAANRMNDWGIVNTNTLHNAAGNQVKIPNVAQDALYPAVYDSLNRLTTIRNTGNTADVASFDCDALGRRIRYEDQDSRFTKWYYYDGVNEILETDGSTDLTWYVHGASYIDERLMMHCAYDSVLREEVNQSYYYAMDRMYDVRYLLDATGAIVESYAYDPYGRSLIRECAGRGDLTGDSVEDANDDQSMFDLARDCQLFDPRADIDNDGDVDGDDATLMGCKQAVWTGSEPTSVRMARSVHGNPYMFQGRPQFAIDTEEGAAAATLLLNDHRNRFADPMTGRWLTRDPVGYADGHNLYQSLGSHPTKSLDPLGLCEGYWACKEQCLIDTVNEEIRNFIAAGGRSSQITPELVGWWESQHLFDCSSKCEKAHPDCDLHGNGRCGNNKKGNGGGSSSPKPKVDCTGYAQDIADAAEDQQDCYFWANVTYYSASGTTWIGAGIGVAVTAGTGSGPAGWGAITVQTGVIANYAKDIAQCNSNYNKAVVRAKRNHPGCP